MLTYKWNDDETQSYEISTGTLGYLVNGQSTMSSDYAGIYKDHSADLLTWQKRSELVNEIWKTGTSDSDLTFQYEEAYGKREYTERPEYTECQWLAITD